MPAGCAPLRKRTPAHCRRRSFAALLACLASAAFWPTGALRAAEPEPLVKATFIDESGQTVAVPGKVVVEALDGGILLLGRDGRLWTITTRQKQSVAPMGRPFSFFDADELGAALKDELGSHFEIIKTKHYVIATAAGPQYAAWCGDLFERLLSAFVTHWKGLGLQLADPAAPLPAIIFPDERQFKVYAGAEAGSFGEESKGFYSIRTNRIVLFDLTAGKGKKRTTSAAEIKRRTAAAAFNVATIVHEATHQIAFNSGMHVRLADNPLWLTEGMAMYFESADVDHLQDGQAIGQVNRGRFDRFLDFVKKRRRRDSISTLVSRTDRFTDSRKASDAYAEAWALTYFLNQKHPNEYVAYLKRLGKKTPLIWDEPGQRLSDFKSAFGEALPALDRELLKFMKSLPARKSSPPTRD